MTHIEGQEHAVPAALQPADFVLDPEAFLQRCHAAFPSPLLPPDGPESKALLAALREGHPKLDIVAAFKFAQNHATPEIAPRRDAELRHQLRHHPKDEDLVALAPEDDRLFVDLVFAHFFSTEPAPMDRLAAYAQLKSGTKSRKTLIQWLAAMSSARAVRWAGSDDEAHDEVVIAAPLPQSVEIGIDASMWLQPPPSPATPHIKLKPGWVLAGPKRDLRPGSWTLEVQLWQPIGARIAIDIVANGGLRVLARFELDGPASLAAAFNVLSSDQLVEARIYKPRQPAGLCHFGLTRLVLKPTSLAKG